MKKRPKDIPVSAELERVVLSALLAGGLTPDGLRGGELSKTGRVVLEAVKRIAADGGRAPYDPSAVSLLATDVLGGEREEIAAVLADVRRTPVGSGASTVLNQIAERRLLAEILNSAGEQLTAGKLDLVGLRGLLDAHQTGGGGDLVPVSEMLSGGFPDPPSFMPLRSLPALTERVGGLYGLWAIAGEPKIGKSTISWQLAIEAGQTMPVLYYDFENGFPVLMSRIRTVYDDNLDKVRRATRQIYYRPTINTLDSDLSRVRPPAFIVVDSVQKLPVSDRFQREGLDRWVHRLETVKKSGYNMLMVSEVPKSYYGARDAAIGANKASGEIEFSADTGFHLLKHPDGVELHVVANRHGPYVGRVSVLRRTHGGFWFEEI